MFPYPPETSEGPSHQTLIAQSTQTAPSRSTSQASITHKQHFDRPYTSLLACNGSFDLPTIRSSPYRADSLDVLVGDERGKEALPGSVEYFGSEYWTPGPHATPDSHGSMGNGRMVCEPSTSQSIEMTAAEDTGSSLTSDTPGQSNKSSGKGMLLDELIRKFNEALRTSPSSGSRQTSSSSSTSGQSSSSASRDSCEIQNTHQSTGTQYRGSQKKRCRLDDDEDETQDGQDSRDPNEGHKTLYAVTQPKAKRFACPYHKKDPATYRKHTACIGQGFKEIRLVKAHLKSAHQRAMTKEQLNDLLDRSKYLLGVSEKEKWERIYRLLFPEDGDTVPDPYVREDWGIPGRFPSNEDKSAAYESYPHDEFLRTIRPGFQSAIEQAGVSNVEQLLDQLMGIVRDARVSVPASRITDNHPAAQSAQAGRGTQPLLCIDKSVELQTEFADIDETVLRSLLDETISDYAQPPMSDSLNLEPVLFTTSTEAFGTLKIPEESANFSYQSGSPSSESCSKRADASPTGSIIFAEFFDWDAHETPM